MKCGRGPEKTAVKKKTKQSVDISEGDEFILVHTSFFHNFLKETICSVCSKKCVSVLITERNRLCVKLVLYCKNCGTVIGENFTSPQMESTNNRQAALVVNQKAVEYTNDIQNITWFEAHKSSQECNANYDMLLVVWKSRLF